MWEDNIELYLSIAVSCLFPMCLSVFLNSAFVKRIRCSPIPNGSVLGRNRAAAPTYPFCLYPSPSSSASWWPDEGLPKKIILIGQSLSQNSLSFSYLMTNRSV